jgi:hypothetical protein
MTGLSGLDAPTVRVLPASRRESTKGVPQALTPRLIRITTPMIGRSVLGIAITM